VELAFEVRPKKKTTGKRNRPRAAFVLWIRCLDLLSKRCTGIQSRWLLDSSDCTRDGDLITNCESEQDVSTEQPRDPWPSSLAIHGPRHTRARTKHRSPGPRPTKVDWHAI
jgi:hypothetical protein